MRFRYCFSLISFFTEDNHLCVTHSDCRRQPLIFKQVKTFLAPPNLTAPPNAWSGSATAYDTAMKGQLCPVAPLSKGKGARVVNGS